ncbi:MAG: S41 family peptidase [Candidatus Izemoplasma sp.]|nr:S41 family peptidase [Candidatus Izemoplasma sp.]
MSKRLVGLLAFIVAIGTSFYIGYNMDTVEPQDTGNQDENPPLNEDGATTITDEVFLEVLESLMENHYTQPSRDLLMEGAVNGMFDALNDPHSSYFDYEEYSQFQSGFEESYVGIGVRVSFVEGQIIVEDVMEGGPAEEAGILPNDIIVSVDGVDITEQNFYDTINMILGEEGTDVVIGIFRQGVDNIIQLTMTRAVIQNASVNYQVFNKNGQKLGYIEVTQFGDETANKFHDAITALEAQNIDGLVIDLRNNGGGHLSTVYNMMNEFLVDNGKPMFSTEYYSDGEFFSNNYYASNSTPKPYDIVTLVNQNSASASEVFASAMQEQGNYPLVGTVTYGKGTMQTDMVVQATVGDRLHISIGKWITSEGNWVHFNGGTDGITPDIIVEPTGAETAYKVFLIDEGPLQVDTVDPRIANVQQIINTMGYNVRTDGYFDQDTYSAIINIQNDHNIPATGMIDEATLTVINAALDAFRDNPSNDSQLQAALDYFSNND